MKNCTRIILFVFLAIGLFFYSCASQLTNSPKIDYTDSKAVLSAYNNYFKNFKTFEAEGSISIITPQYKSRSLRIHTYIIFPDSIRIKIEGPLGIDGVSLFVDGTDYLYYDHRAQVSEKGSLNNLDFASMLHDSINIDIEESATYLADLKNEIITFFSGMKVVNPADYSRVIADEEYTKENIFISSINKNEIIKFQTNKTDLEVEHISDSKGDLIIEKKFERYLSFGNVRFPRLIRYNFIKERSRFRIVYRNFRVNNKISNENFIIKIK